MTPFIVLAAIVLLWLLYPIRQRSIYFDEKDEVIKIYREEVAYIEQQCQKELITNDSRVQLLDELDKKSAMAMLAIAQRTFAYRSAIVPTIVVILVLGASSALYAKLYREQAVDKWHASAEKYESAIVEGLFDRDVVNKTLAENDKLARNNYCFLLQHHLLRQYATNPDALMNVAECHLQLGYGSLAEPAIDRALRSNREHQRANYVQGQLEFLRRQQLTKSTKAQLTKLANKVSPSVDILYLLALDDFSQGQFNEAKILLEKLKPLADSRAGLKGAIADLENKIIQHSPAAPKKKKEQSKESNVSNVVPDSSEKTLESEENATKSVETSNDAAKSTASDNDVAKISEFGSAAGFSAMISLNEDLREGLTLPKTLFVIVKSAEGQLLTAAKLGFTNAEKQLPVTLQDGQPGLMQMIPLAGFKQVQVTARISQTGQTMAQSGDLTSLPVTVTLGENEPVAITISKRVE